MMATSVVKIRRPKLTCGRCISPALEGSGMLGWEPWNGDQNHKTYGWKLAHDSYSDASWHILVGLMWEIQLRLFLIIIRIPTAPKKGISKHPSFRKNEHVSGCFKKSPYSTLKTSKQYWKSNGSSTLHCQPRIPCNQATLSWLGSCTPVHSTRSKSFLTDFGMVYWIPTIDI